MKSSAISKALDFIEREQSIEGGFCLSDGIAQSMSCPKTSPWVTAFILRSLRRVAVSAKIHGINERALKFLQQEMRGPGLWCFWSKSSRLVCSLDTDTSSLVGRIFVEQGHFLPVNRDLFIKNKGGAGELLLWITEDSFNPRALQSFFAHDPTDLCANLNAFEYLGMRGKVPPDLWALLKAALSETLQRSSPGETDNLLLAYTVAHTNILGSYGHDYTSEAFARLLRDRTFVQSCDAFQAAITLAGAPEIIMNADAKSSLTKLIASSQEPDGGWSRFEFSTGHGTFSGARAVTTAMCAEALSRSMYEPETNRTAEDVFVYSQQR